MIPKEQPNTAPLYGTITGGNSSKGWKISIDIFPVDFKNIAKVKGLCIRILWKVEEEKELDPHDFEKDDELNDDNFFLSPWVTVSNYFAKLDKDVLNVANHFVLPYNVTDSISCDVVKDSDTVDYSTFEVQSLDIDIDLNDSIADNF